MICEMMAVLETGCGCCCWALGGDGVGEGGCASRESLSSQTDTGWELDDSGSVSSEWVNPESSSITLMRWSESSCPAVALRCSSDLEARWSCWERGWVENRGAANAP